MTASTPRPTAHEPTTPLFPRVTTGNPAADEILEGGFPANSINVIMGQPGSGKTIFAEQLAFHNAESPGVADARPVLYLTTLSEPLAKVVSYLQRFAFYDEAKLGTTVLYDDLGAALAEGGVEALVPHVREAITTLSPKLLVIDSFKVLHDLEPSALVMRRMMSELAGLLTAYDVTTFLVGEYTEAHIAQYPEFAVADAIVQLARHQLTARDERYIRVFKLRGSSYREGIHGLRITNDGLAIFPRLVSPEIPEGYEIELVRVPSGVPGLDAMIGGGLWRGSTTLLAGQTGAGKTTMALQFALEGVRRGEPSLYVNFQENPTQLVRLVRALGMEPAEAKARGFAFLYRSSVELQIDSIIGEIHAAIRGGGVRRVVIDAVGDLANAAADQQRLLDYLYTLTQHFSVMGVTSVLTYEAPGLGATAMVGQPTHDLRFSYLTDNVVLLALADETSGRSIRILKSRNTAHDPRVHELALGDAGASVRPRPAGDRAP